MLGRPVLGSRTWMCTIAAPALAASSADAAICSGVTGTAGFFPAVSADPVTAHEIITLRDTPALPETTFGVTYNALPEPDTASVRMTRRRSLPQIVRCAKPRRTRLGTNPSWNQQRFQPKPECSLRA